MLNSYNSVFTGFISRFQPPLDCRLLIGDWRLMIALRLLIVDWRLVIGDWEVFSIINQQSSIKGLSIEKPFQSGTIFSINNQQSTIINPGAINNHLAYGIRIALFI
jgi:hypothetical protein